MGKVSESPGEGCRAPVIIHGPLNPAVKEVSEGPCSENHRNKMVPGARFTSKDSVSLFLTYSLGLCKRKREGTAAPKTIRKWAYHMYCSEAGD